MKSLFKAMLLIVCAVVLTACFPESYSWNQKITIVVETPHGIKTGSAVTHVEWNENTQFLPNINPFTSEVRGEAAVVDLGEGQYLFALIKNAPTIAMHTYAEMPKGPYGSQALKSRASAVVKSDGEKREVPKSGYPMFVTFDDIDDPASVKRVDPDNLAATFGPGYSLKSVTLEITDEAVTEGQVEEEMFSWRGKIPNDYWRGKLTSEQRKLLSSVNWSKD